MSATTTRTNTMTVHPGDVHTILSALAETEGLAVGANGATAVYSTAYHLEKELKKLGYPLAEVPDFTTDAPDIFHADSLGVTRITVMHLCWLIEAIRAAFGREPNEALMARLGLPAVEAYVGAQAALRDHQAANGAVALTGETQAAMPLPADRPVSSVPGGGER